MEIAKNRKLDLPATNINTFKLFFIKSNLHPIAPPRQRLTIEKGLFNFKSTLFLSRSLSEIKLSLNVLNELLFPETFRLIWYISKKKRKTNVCSDISTRFRFDFTKAYSETFRTELSAKIINDREPLNISINPRWFSLNNSETVKAVTLAFYSI